MVPPSPFAFICDDVSDRLILATPLQFYIYVQNDWSGGYENHSLLNLCTQQTGAIQVTSDCVGFVQ